MKKIKLAAIEDEFDDYEDEFEDGKGLHFEFDLTPYVITCAMASGFPRMEFSLSSNSLTPPTPFR